VASVPRPDLPTAVRLAESMYTFSMVFALLF